MINITIGLDGIPSEKKVLLGNQWENEDEEIIFNLPEEFADYHKYMIAVMKQSGGNKTVVLPINNDTFVVSSAITYLSGNWYMYVMCRQNEIDIEYENIDIGALDGEHVFIADGFIGIISKTLIEKDSVDNIPLDTNLEIIYEDLLKLKDDLIAKINAPHDYNNAINKPSINNVELTGNKTSEDLGLASVETAKKLDDKINTKLNINQGTDNANKFMSINGDGNIVPTDLPKDYNELDNKPSINGIELNGNKTPDDLKIATKTIQKQTSLLASGWINDLSPYIYTISDSDIRSDSIVNVNMAFDPSMEQIRAFSDAVIVAYSQSNGKYQLKAYGVKPSMDLPILLTIGM